MEENYGEVMASTLHVVIVENGDEFIDHPARYPGFRARSISNDVLQPRTNVGFFAPLPGPPPRVLLVVTTSSTATEPVCCVDGYRHKIRIVERLGEISGARASSAASESQHVYSSGSAGGARASTPPANTLTPATGGPGAQGTRGGSGTCRPGVHESWSPFGVVGSESSSMSCVSTSGGTGEGSSIGVGAGGLGGVGSTGVVARGGNDLGQQLPLDDTALNELGDAQLEVLLEQMWMKVMGQVRHRELAVCIMLESK